MIKFKKNKNLTVSISSIFIDKYMAKANGTFVKVYLYGLMHSSIPGSNINNSDIANALDILESDVHKAWKYWEKINIIKINANSDDFDIEFLDLTDEITPKDEKITQSKPSYDPKEISIYINKNPEINHLYNFAESKLGKQFNSNDLSTLFSFYDWLRLPVEVIVMLIEYCSSIDKTNMRYIEKVAIDWADKGINSNEKAESHLKNLELQNSNLDIIRRSLGLSSYLTDAQMDYVNKWINEYNFSIDLIKYACEQTVLNTGKANIKYVHSILEDWHSKNIKCLDQVLKEKECYKQKNANNNSNQSKTAQPKVSKNNKFLNFTQRDTDFDEVVRLITQKSQKESRSS